MIAHETGGRDQGSRLAWPPFGLTRVRLLSLFLSSLCFVSFGFGAALVPLQAGIRHQWRLQPRWDSVRQAERKREKRKGKGKGKGKGKEKRERGKGKGKRTDSQGQGMSEHDHPPQRGGARIREVLDRRCVRYSM